MNAFGQIYEVVRSIPKGKVATYGQVARLAGNPRWSRVVGYALHSSSKQIQLPCHRVVDRHGHTAPVFRVDGVDLQQKMLEAEGVEFLEDGRVDLNRYLW